MGEMVQSNNCKQLSMSPTITITYELKPPTSIDAEGLATAKTGNLNVKSTPADGHKVYYTALREAIEEARNQVGDELTVWRDRVGKAELTKEPQKADDDEEGEEEERPEV